MNDDMGTAFVVIGDEDRPWWNYYDCRIGLGSNTKKFNFN